jgi:hypothetical protein
MKRAVCAFFGHDRESFVDKKPEGDYMGVRCSYCNTRFPADSSKSKSPYVAMKPKGRTHWRIV